MCSGSEKVAVFLGHVHVRFLLCMLSCLVASFLCSSKNMPVCGLDKIQYVTPRCGVISYAKPSIPRIGSCTVLTCVMSVSLKSSETLHSDGVTLLAH